MVRIGPQSCKKSNSPILLVNEDPLVVWQKLQNQFQKKTWANKLALQCRLHSLQLKDGESVQDHVKAMTAGA